MPKLKKKSRRLLRFVVIAAIMILAPVIFLNFTYGLQYSHNKNNEFIGTHKEYADLIISKTVKNSNGAELTSAQKAEEFIFTVFFSVSNSEYKVKIGNEEQTIKSGGTITLKHGQTAVISGIPEGASYRIIETKEAGYTIAGSHHTGSIDKNGSKAEFINIAQNTVPTTTVQPPPPTTVHIPTQPITTTNRPTEPQTTYNVPQQPPTMPVNPPETTGYQDNYNTTEPTLDTGIYNTTEEPSEHIGDSLVPRGSGEVITEPSDYIVPVGTTAETTAPNENIGDNIVPKGNNDNNGNITPTIGGAKTNPPTGNSPKTGDDEIDPRLWLVILAISAFVLRYLLFFREKTESDNHSLNQD